MEGVRAPRRRLPGEGAAVAILLRGRGAVRAGSQDVLGPAAASAALGRLARQTVRAGWRRGGKEAVLT